MGYSLVLTSRAIKDLHQIVAYIACSNPIAACRLEEALLDKADLLLANPEMGVAVKRRAGVRFTLHRSYLIFYRIIPVAQEIKVLRFLHGARDIAKIKF